MKAAVMIEAKLTGRDSVVVHPEAITNMIERSDGLTIGLCDGQSLRFVMARGDVAGNVKAIFELLFDESTLERVYAIQKATKKLLNPDAIDAVESAGGVVRILLRGGTILAVPMNSFGQYREIVAAVYGDEFAAKLKPYQAPAPAPQQSLMQRAKAVIAKPLNSDEMYQKRIDDALGRARRAPEKLAARVLQRVTSTDRVVRGMGILHVLDEMEMLTPLRGFKALQEEPGLTLVQEFDAMALKLRRAAAALMSDDAAVALRSFALVVSEFMERLEALPLPPEAKGLKKEYADQLYRISDLQASSTADVVSLPVGRGVDAGKGLTTSYAGSL